MSVLDPVRLHLTFDPADKPDWETACKHLSPADDVVVVEMMPTPEMIGSLYIPEVAKRTHYDEDGNPMAGLEPSVGCVLNSDFCTQYGEPPLPGELALCVDGDGLEISGFKAGEYEASEPVRFFGLIVPDGFAGAGYVEDMPWDESVVAILVDDGIAIERMTGKNILIKRPHAENKTESGIWLSDYAVMGPCEAVIEMVGDRVEGYKPGDKIIYHPSAVIEYFDKGRDHYRIIREKAIFTVIE